MSSTDKAPLVCVTGAAGFVGAHICKALLDRGFRVRGTVRSRKPEKVKHLLNLGTQENRIDLWEADLLQEGSFDDVISGCTYVIHSASPYHMKVSDPQNQLIKPAVNGTLNVLRSCYKAKSVKRVVLTSSTAAITDDFAPAKVYKESDWNTKSSEKRNPYFYSKRLSEQAAQNFVYEHQGDIFDLVIINPSITIGPALDYPAELNISTMIIRLCMLLPVIIDLGFPLVDVRDVAVAHVLAMENPDAKGRYITYNTTLKMKDVCGILRHFFPNHNVATLEATTAPIVTEIIKIFGKIYHTGILDFVRTHVGKFPLFSNVRTTQELGLVYTDVWVSLRDTVKDLIEKGYLPDKPMRSSL